MLLPPRLAAVCDLSAPLVSMLGPPDMRRLGATPLRGVVRLLPSLAEIGRLRRTEPRLFLSERSEGVGLRKKSGRFRLGSDGVVIFAD